MSSHEIVRFKKKVIAIIIRKNVKVEGIKFYSPQNYPFQIGFHNRPAQTVLKPHFHPPHNFFIKSNQEVLFILKGKIKISLYNQENKYLASKVLTTGDSILFVSGGHGVKFLQKSKIFEVKQGPYPGDKKAKVFI